MKQTSVIASSLLAAFALAACGGGSGSSAEGETTRHEVTTPPAPAPGASDNATGQTAGPTPPPAETPASAPQTPPAAETPASQPTPTPPPPPPPPPEPEPEPEHPPLPDPSTYKTTITAAQLASCPGSMSPVQISQLNCLTGIYYGWMTNSSGQLTATPKICKVVIGQDGRASMAVLTGHYEEVMIDTVKPTELGPLAQSGFTVSTSDTTLRYVLDSTHYNEGGSVKDAFFHYVTKPLNSTQWTLWSTFFSKWTPGTIGCRAEINTP